jgi:uncharacterized protein YdiU (UPF0061 family)
MMTTTAASPAFDTTFASLPDRFYSYAQPVTVANATTIIHNPTLAKELGIDPQWLASDEANGSGLCRSPIWLVQSTTR